jgi:S-adenosylmethionine hydrolase
VRPIVLLTDFGTKDHYVGVMHAVLAAEAPEVERIDLCHDVPPGDVWAASFLLRSAWRHLPPRAVVLAVVDPGVGGTRRPVAVRVEDRHIVAPDNGSAAAIVPVDDSVELDWRTMELAEPSKTFHGRDLFAPAAARLAVGVSLSRLGPAAATDLLHECPIPRPQRIGSGWRATVVHVDRFGNLITNLEAAAVSGPVIARYGHQMKARQVAAYVDASDDEVVLLEGSSGWLEMAVQCDSAEERTGLRRGDCIDVIEVGGTSALS